MDLQKVIEAIRPLDEFAMEQAQRRLDGIAKPLGSLGKLEDLLIKGAGICRSQNVDFSKKAIVALCADNGVVEEGVTQTSSDITALVADNMTKKQACVAIMAEKMQADIVVVDMGMIKDPQNEAILNRKIAYGSKNMAKEPAMSYDEALLSLQYGIELAFALKDQNYGLLATGEMGIGNTTTSSAMTAIFLDKKVREVTGRGAGLSSHGLEKKIAVIEKAIALHQPNKNDPIDVLAKLGGFDIGGLAGVFLGCGACGLPVLVDGFISGVAALLAVRICPLVKNYLYGSHLSQEPGARMVLDELGIGYFLDCNMRLGEGTGAVASFGLFDMAQEIYERMSSFEDIEMDAYQPLD
ncbi:MAG: nicotinate-nucleotide--dimethylbenzimidazole phosphoribosyltransferase [Clostridiales bacterium]